MVAAKPDWWVDSRVDAAGDCADRVLVNAAMQHRAILAGKIIALNTRCLSGLFQRWLSWCKKREIMGNLGVATDEEDRFKLAKIGSGD